MQAGLLFPVKRLLVLFTLLLCSIPSVWSIWPFPTQRFKGNSLIGAGSMGINEGDRAIAFGDFNGDQL